MPSDYSSSPSPIRVDQVVAAVRELFRRYGYRRTSVDDIAREAGISKATLYLHFASKEEMFRAMTRQFREVVIARCRAAEASADPVETRIVELLYAGYGTALEWFGDAAHIRELKSVAAEQPLDAAGDDRSAFRERLERLLRTAQAAGEIELAARGASAKEVAAALMFAAHGAKLAQRDGAEGFREAAASIVRLVVGPLRAPAPASSP